jgi:4-hydroxybenzoate polyprenyltransferase
MRFLLWRQGGILRYNSVWQNLAALLFIVLTTQPFDGVFYLRVVMFALFSTLMTGYGYLINDLADRHLDRQHGKRNAFDGMGRARARAVVIAIAALGALCALPFVPRAGFAPIWLLWIATATFYSLPPLRLKEHGVLGLIATISAQQTLPTALLFSAFGDVWSVSALIFVLFAAARGTSSDVGHQMRDWVVDSGTDTRTFAVQHGLARTQKLYAISLELERLALGVVMALLLVEVPPVALPWMALRVSPIWPVLLLYIVLWVRTIGRSLQAWRQGRLFDDDPYNEARQARVRDALHVIHHALPSVLLPLYLALWATLAYWPNALFVLILGLLYGLYSPHRWAAAWPLRPLLAWLRSRAAA